MSNVEALYYDLNDATEILSKRLSIHNLTTKKIIKFIAQFKIPLHVYGFGFSITGDFNSLQQYSKPKDDFLIRVEKDLSERNTETGSLFQISDEIVTLFQFHNTLPVSQFSDVIPLSTLRYANSAIESLRLTMDDFKNKEEGFEVLALYAHITVNYLYDGEDLSKGLINGIQIKPKFNVWETYEIDENEFDMCLNIGDFTVKFDDLILIKSNLHRLEAYLSGNEISSPIFIENRIQQKPRIKNPGVSQQKINAKIVAQAFAKHFWALDKNQSIKIKDMTTNVYIALKETEYLAQLPDKTISLKDWIKDVAPSYAREAGRPKEL